MPETPPAAPEDAPSPRRPRSRRRWIALAVATLAVAGVAYYVVSRIGVESTDDAFIDGNIYRVSFKVPGRVAHVHVADNEVVEAGQLLAELDPAQFQARVDAARAELTLEKARLREARVQVELTDAETTAALARARARLVAAQAHLEQQNADLESARAEATRASADLSRYQTLSERAVSKERLDLIRQTSTVADAKLKAVQKGIASAQADVTAAETDVQSAEADRKKVDAASAAAERYAAEVARSEAELREAEIDLADTKVEAPAAGRVTKKAILEGTYLQAGQTLMSIVAPDVWVTANFKETQLEDMRPGQAARISVDAYGIELHGHIDSIMAGTGSRFSLLPPENATGNYVKVVQRVPVKIVLDDQPDPERYLLGPGMSVVPTVTTR